MSKRFNPLTAGVAAVTATVILGIGGCAMGTRTASTDQTDSAGLSRGANDNSQAANQVAQVDMSATPSTTVNLPATSVAQAEPMATPAPMANDTAAIPPADRSTATTASTDMSSTRTATSMDTSASTTGSDQPLPPRVDRN